MTRLSEEAQFIPVRKKSAPRKMDCTAYGTCPERDSTMNQDHENHSDNQFRNKFSLQHSPSQLDVSGVPGGQDKVGEQGITLPILLGCCILDLSVHQASYQKQEKPAKHLLRAPTASHK